MKSRKLFIFLNFRLIFYKLRWIIFDDKFAFSSCTPVAEGLRTRREVPDFHSDVAWVIVRGTAASTIRAQSFAALLL